MPHAPSKLAPGDAPGEPLGKYRLLKLLARGGMAEVHLAEGPNPRGDPLVAVKLLLPAIASDREFLALFIEEARLAAPLAHRNLVQIDDLGIVAGRLYLSMEYIHGYALSVLLARHVAVGTAVPPPLAAAAIAQACRGLDHAHGYRGLGLVHRDVSPQNLMLRFDGVVKVVDFGVAKATAVSGTRTTHLKGKLPYMSPEQLHGRGIDRRTDVFAMGASLFELLCGRRMFPGRNDAEVFKQILYERLPDVRDVNPYVPDALADIVQRACARQSKARTPSCAALADALEAFVRPLLPSPQAALAALAAEHFDPLPRTREEALAFASPVEEIDLGQLGVAADTDPSSPARQPHPTRSENEPIAPEARERVTVPLALRPESVELLAAPASGTAPNAPSRATTETAHPLGLPGARRRLAAATAVAALALGAAAFGALRFGSARATPPPAPAAASAPAPKPPALEKARLVLKTFPPAKVLLGGRLLGDTPLGVETPVEVEPGPQTLLLQNEAVGDRKLVLDLQPGQTWDSGAEAVNLRTLPPAP